MTDIVAYGPPKPAIKGIPAFCPLSFFEFFRIALQ
jgi:hypothetical protein